MRIDLTTETDHDKIAQRAMCVVSDVREVSPQLTLDTLTIMCATEPARMAQVMMALAIWVDLDLTTGTLASRAEAALIRRAAA